MGISKTNLGTTVDSIKKFIEEKIPSNHNALIGREENDAHPISSITNLQTEIDKIDNMSIAQKIINKRGIKELLDSEVLMTVSTAATTGTSVTTSVNKDINLKESIDNYDFINIHFTINSAERKYNFPTKLINTKSIVYNNTNISLNDGSVILSEMNLPSGVPQSYGSLDIGFRIWFKTTTQLYIADAVNPMGDLYNTMSIESIEGINIDSTVIDPVEYVNTSQGIEDSPVGHILSIMGTSPPKHYLTCDGGEYNITDYPYLSQHIKDEFGTFNFFGGDGTTTFAVPDLRNEFLRGYHGEGTEQLSGDIGIHQDATSHINTWAQNALVVEGQIGTYTHPSNIDKKLGPTNFGRLFNGSSYNTEGYYTNYNSRPTNVAVLFCIKYEPTYFMSIQGMIEETVLWEGNVGTNATPQVSSTIQLLDTLANYNKFGIYYNFANTSGTIHYKYKEFQVDELTYIIQLQGDTTLTILEQYQTAIYSYINIMPSSTNTQFNINLSRSNIIKIIGIKFKTFAN